MKTISLTIWLALASITFGEQVSVDFSSLGSSVTHAGSGVLHSINATTPNDDLLSAIKPQLFRAFPWGDQYDRAVSLGAHYQRVVSDSYTYGTMPFPGDNGDYTQWEGFLRNMVTTDLAQGKTVEYDIWNEPDNVFWPRSQAQFLEAWKHGVNAIRSVDPNATIIGPSISTYWWYTNLNVEGFLTYAKANNVLPNVIAWHSWDHNLGNEITQLRSFAAANGIDASRISINEYLAGQDAFRPGAVPYFLNTIERNNVESAAKSCWTTCFDNSLDGLVTSSGQPTSIWWVYQRYGMMNGPTALTVSGTSLDAIASQAVGVSYALIGRSSPNNDAATVLLQKIDPSLLIGGQIHVLAELIQDSETAASLGPITTINADYITIDGSFSLALPNFGSYDAYFVTLTPVALPGDYNGDGVVNAADYLLMRTENYTPNAYSVWRSHFGMSLPSLGSSGSVPEPSTLLLFVLSFGLLGMSRIRDISIVYEKLDDLVERIDPHSDLCYCDLCELKRQLKRLLNQE